LRFLLRLPNFSTSFLAVSATSFLLLGDSYSALLLGLFGVGGGSFYIRCLNLVKVLFLINFDPSNSAG
jgi:hypothetical protein